METATRVVIKEGRLSYASIDKPKKQRNGNLKYQTAIMWPKSDKATTKKVRAAVEAAKEDGITRLWGGKLPKKYESPIKDGDDKDDDENYEGMWYINASSKQKPEVFNRKGKDVTEKEGVVYSGCYVHASVNTYPFNVDGNIGVGFGLNGLMFWEDGEPLAGGGSSHGDFEKFFDQGDDDDEDDDEDEAPAKKKKKKPVDDDEDEDEEEPPRKKKAAAPAKKPVKKRPVDDDDEDEDDEDEEPPRKKKPAPTAKKPAKKREYDEDDDDEEEEDPRPAKKKKKKPADDDDDDLPF